MFRYALEIFEALRKGFVTGNKRFPSEKEADFLKNFASKISNSLRQSGIDLEKISAEDAIKMYSKPPSKPAGIEALPLKDEKLREQALSKAMKARNQQAKEGLLRKKEGIKNLPEGEPFATGGSVKKSLTEKIVNILGGKDATAAELGILGTEQLYNLLGLPFNFSNGGAVGMPPISTSDPKQAGKIIIDSFLGSSIENIPLYQGNGLGITAGVGLGNQRPFDYGIGFNYGDFQGGVQMHEGKPSFGIGYRKEFSNGGGVKSGPPPERGPNPQGLETLFQKR